MAICEKHGIEKRQVPAGVSKKTNKPYSAFEVCGLCQNEKGAQSFVQRAQEFTQPKDDSIAKMAKDKKESIEKMHETKMRAECLRAAAEVCVATKQTDFQQIIDVAESYWKWLKDEPPF